MCQYVYGAMTKFSFKQCHLSWLFGNLFPKKYIKKNKTKTKTTKNK